MKRPFWWVLICVAIIAVGVFNHFKGADPGAALAGPPLMQSAPRGVADVTLQSIFIDGTGTGTTAVVGNGGSVVLHAGYDLRSIIDNPAITVRLERRASTGGWTSTGRLAAVSPGSPLTASTPAYATSRASETIQYRFASDTSASQPISVVYENQDRYSGMAATIYGYAAPYCPHTAVHITPLSGREAGLYGTGALLIRIDPEVGRSTVMRPVDQRALAIHECAHELQWLNYGGTAAGDERMRAAAATRFMVGSNGAAPLEHGADCSAKSVNPGGYLGYGGYCTRAELYEGERILTGLRY